ncbi:histone-lysine N-methyltransferase eggless isoform X2 [Leptidea sinapis]|uniref:histone-lysine N-methyltransferase eggless isoform X2 n=1 Tax=Leptidea sinapis TaxID=189913 RepID=UPI0021C36A1E|nr:histone-lysine N-methyltransferase eggless isoform X2 [Leptidea sinapis]
MSSINERTETSKEVAEFETPAANTSTPTESHDLDILSCGDHKSNLNQSKGFPIVKDPKAVLSPIKNSVLQEPDEDILLLDGDDEDQDVNIPNECIEDELLKDSDAEMPLQSIEYSKTSKLKTPNVMLEIPSQEVIEFSDDECDFSENAIMLPDIEKSVLEESTVVQEITKDTHALKSDIPIKPVDCQVSTVEHRPNLGKMLLESLERENKELDEEVFVVDANISDAEPEESEMSPAQLDNIEETNLNTEIIKIIKDTHTVKPQFSSEPFICDEVNNDEHGSNLEKMLLESLERENQELDKELLAITTKKLDTETDKLVTSTANSENIDMSNIDNDTNEIDVEISDMCKITHQDVKADESDEDECVILEDDPPVENIITEEEELKNAIQGIEQESLTISNNCDNIEKLISEVQEDTHEQIDVESSIEQEDINIDIDDDADDFDITLCPQDQAVDIEYEKTAIEGETKTNKLDTSSTDAETTPIVTAVSENSPVNIVDNSIDVEMTASTTAVAENIPEDMMENESVSNIEEENTSNVNQLLSTVSTVPEESSDTETQEQICSEMPTDVDVPSNSKISDEEVLIEEGENQPSTSGCIQEEKNVVHSSDNLISEEITEDSLGLLAESSRVMDDEEEDEDDGDGDDDEDFDQDDESNQMMVDNSEDSNTHQSETDMPKESLPPNQGVLICNVDETTGDSEVECEKKSKSAVDIPEVSEEMEVDTNGPAEYTEPVKISSVERSAAISSSPTKLQPVINIVYLADSSDDDVTEVPKATEVGDEEEPGTTTVNLPGEIAVTGISGSTYHMDIKTSQGEIVISGIPKPPPAKPARLNTSEVSIKRTKQTAPEIFSLDSDEDDNSCDVEIPPTQTKTQIEKQDTIKCVNKNCNNECSQYVIADNSTTTYYHGDKDRYYCVCLPCADVVKRRNEQLIESIRNFDDLLTLQLNTTSEDLVEISDSDSDCELELQEMDKGVIGDDGAKILERELADLINFTWNKYNMDERVAAATEKFKEEIVQFELNTEILDSMIVDCQATTDKLRNDLYATFQPNIRELPPIEIVDVTGPPAELVSAVKDDDDRDISVVKLSAEMAPADLPPPGDVVKPELRVGMQVYAMRNLFGTWCKARIIEILNTSGSLFTSCKVRYEGKAKNQYKVISARSMAYAEPANARMTIGMRVIALFQDSNIDKKESFYSGVVAEVPNPVNNYRYLIFFDDGYAQYASHANTRPVCQCSSLVWEEMHQLSREFVKQYLMAYPERPMVRLHAGQVLETEWDGKWWTSRVVKVDASLVQIRFANDKGRLEWIYRGSTRLAPLFRELQAAEKPRHRAMPKAQAHSRINMPYVEYTRTDEQINKSEATQQQNVETQGRRQRSVAKKSTVSMNLYPIPPQPQLPSVRLENFTSRVVYYTPKNAVKPHKMVPHMCGPRCKRTDVLSLYELRTYNPLAKPLLSGWERQIVRWKGRKEVLYCTPCGRRVRNVGELHQYLRLIGSDMGVDLFDFNASTHCLAEFVINKCIISKKDLSHGKENVPVPCVNYYDESLPEFCSYNTERTPTTGVPLNVDPDFLCGCDCDDDCLDKSKCACWKLTLEGARTIGLDGDIGYNYKRLLEPLPSGIYECNSRCKCKSTCMNRVAQHPLQLKLQVFKTMNRGWGIRALNDVPKGAFICIYAGNLLTDATANLDGLNEGDEYLAELDYIEVVEQMKEGYEEDVPESIKKLDRGDSVNRVDTTSESDQDGSSEEEVVNKMEDDDFVPSYIGPRPAEFNKRLRKRAKKEKKEDEKAEETPAVNNQQQDKKDEDECITISDDEEVCREPSRFAAAAGMGANAFKPKHKSVRTLYGSEEACYIMDAKVQGNIGRYLNHSCSPNVFVQNVFVDTHDPRFPWVAFFALCHIKAGTELTWNYNYDVGSVPGKVLYCFCGAPNCRRRLL